MLRYVTICILLIHHAFGQVPASGFIDFHLKFPDETTIKKLGIYKIIAIDVYDDEDDTSEFWFFDNKGRVVRYEMTPPDRDLDDTVNSLTMYFYSKNRISKILETGYSSNKTKYGNADSAWIFFDYDRKGKLVSETRTGYLDYVIHYKYDKDRLSFKVYTNRFGIDTTFYNELGFPLRLVSRHQNSLTKWYYSKIGQIDSIWNSSISDSLFPKYKTYLKYNGIGQLIWEQQVYFKEKKIISYDQDSYVYNNNSCVNSIYTVTRTTKDKSREYLYLMR